MARLRVATANAQSCCATTATLDAAQDSTIPLRLLSSYLGLAVRPKKQGGNRSFRNLCGPTQYSQQASAGQVSCPRCRNDPSSTQSKQRAYSCGTGGYRRRDGQAAI